MNPPFDDPTKAHRWFAVMCNNAAWDIIEDTNRSPEACENLLHIAHASLWHWDHAGTPVNRYRALSLIAFAYLVAGVPERALHYGNACGTLNPEGITNFDRALAYGCTARACELADGDGGLFHARALCKRALANLTDEDEQETATQFLNLIGMTL